MGERTIQTTDGIDWLWFLIYVLAVFRLSLMISKENGPAWMFWHLRQAPSKKSSLHEGIQCQWCVSLWMASLIGNFVWLKRYLPGEVIYWIDGCIFVLALSAGAIIINQTFTKDSSR